MCKQLFILLFLIPFGVSAQLSPQNNSTIDSLKKVITSATHDSIKINAYFKWDDLIYVTDPKLDEKINLNVKSLCKKNLSKKLTLKEKRFFQRKLAFAHNNLGIIAMYKSDYKTAEHNYKQTIKWSQQSGDLQKTAAAYNNIGILYFRQGDLKSAIDYYLNGLQKLEMAKDSNGVAGALNNIGSVYNSIGNRKKAKEYFYKSLDISTKIGNKIWAATSYNNLAEYYLKDGDTSKMMEYYNKSVALNQEAGNKQGIASSIGNLGSYNMIAGNYKKALKLYEQSYSLMLEVGDMRGAAISLNSIARAHYSLGNYKKSIDYSNEALSLLTKMDKVSEAINVTQNLYQAYRKTGDYKKSLEMHEMYVKLRDSLNNNENARVIIEKEFQYNYDKRVLADSIKNLEAEKLRKAEKEKQLAETSRQKQQKYFLYVILSLALLFGIFIYNRFKHTQKQKGIIEDQKKKVDLAYLELEAKNKEIMDSIHYAKRIQQAQLPTTKFLEKHLSKKNPG